MTFNHSIPFLSKISKIAENYIIRYLTTFGSGLPAKAAQMLSSKNATGNCDLSNLLMSDKEVSSVFLSHPDICNKISTFSFDGIAGSLGEVHKAMLGNGSEVAIKIQYPRIENKIQSQLEKLLQVAGISAKINSKKFNYNDYQKLFSQTLKEETDYVIEAQNQKYFYDMFSQKTNVIVPKVYPELSNSNILVQEWLAFKSFQDLNHLTKENKETIAYNLIEIFLFMFFNLKKLQSDFHLGNLGVINENPYKIVLLDFGSILKIEENHTYILSETILNIRNNISYDSMLVFKNLGFNTELLLPLKDDLNKLLLLLLYPFCTKGPINLNQWNFQEESKLILGKHKMAFRMAGPPYFLMLMRTFTGLTSCLKSITNTVNINDLVEKYI